jgi:hypothetical protein
VNLELVHKIADAVLYEGYLLYPYRPSSVKNRQRWTFGGLYPPSFAERAREASGFEAQLLVIGAEAVVSIEVRFLHLRAQPRRDGESWQEATDRSMMVDALRVSDLATETHEQRFAFTPSLEGGVRQEHLQATIETSTVRIAEALHKLTIRVSNGSPIELPPSVPRDQASMHALVSAHAIVTVANGEFVSLTDPPEAFRKAAGLCSNRGVWPVLAGEPGARDCVLASPIILSDYPEIAPESAGDLFDSSEIDEILTLRILTMTDAEKEEMRNSDPRARKLLERTEALSTDHLMKLHGALRDPYPNSIPARSEK